MPEQIVDVPFPVNGVSRQQGFDTQRPLTTYSGVNVRTFEPLTDRARGGSRTGLAKFVAGQVPAGAHLLQDLAVVVKTDTTALLDNDPVAPFDPVTGLPSIDDPSSPGDPSSWGTIPILFDPITGLPVDDPTTGTPITGTTEKSRNPGGPGSTGDVGPQQRRHGGSGVPPNKNTVAYAPPNTGDLWCFTGYAVFTVHKPPPDVFHWDGQQPAVQRTFCYPWFPLLPAVPPDSVLDAILIPLIDEYMAVHVNGDGGPPGTYTITAKGAGVPPAHKCGSGAHLGSACDD